MTGSRRKRPLSRCRRGDSGPNLTRSKLASSLQNWAIWVPLGGSR